MDRCYRNWCTARSGLALVLLALGVAHTNAIQAQTSFSRIYDLPVDATLTSAAHMPDGGFVLVGQASQTGDGLLMRVDASGNTLWARRCPAIGPNDSGSQSFLVPYEDNDYQSVTTDPDGNIYVGGNSRSTQNSYSAH